MVDQQHDGAREVRIEELRHRDEKRGGEIGAAHAPTVASERGAAPRRTSRSGPDVAPAAAARRGSGAALLLLGFCSRRRAPRSSRARRTTPTPCCWRRSPPRRSSRAPPSAARCSRGARLLPRGLAPRNGRLSDAGRSRCSALGFVCVSHALSLAARLARAARQRDPRRDRPRGRDDERALAPPRACSALGLAPAFGEELLFRGLVQQARAARARRGRWRDRCSRRPLRRDPPRSRAVAGGVRPRPLPRRGGRARRRAAGSILCHARQQHARGARRPPAGVATCRAELGGAVAGAASRPVPGRSSSWPGGTRRGARAPRGIRPIPGVG